MATELIIEKATNIDHRAAPFIIEGQSGSPAFLLLHGLTASPTEVQPLADYLHQRFSNASISCPLLPGHGSTPQHLHKVSHDLWLTVAQNELQRLFSITDHVSVVGVSMGAVLAAHLAATEPKVCSLTMLSPMFFLKPALRACLPWLRFIVPYKMKSRASIDNHIAKRLFSYDCYPTRSLLELQRLANQTLVRMPSIQCPVLLAYGNLDPYITKSSLQRVRRRLTSESIEIVECAHSSHVLPHEPDAEMLFEKIHTHVSSTIRQA